MKLNLSRPVHFILKVKLLKIYAVDLNCTNLELVLLSAAILFFLSKVL